jgi:copper chaperone CopZ
MNDEKICPVPSDSVPPGIAKTTVETDGQSMVIDYDPRAISDESVRQVAARLVPETQRRFDKCVMRLGGCACEACALKLERKAQRIQGVRRARATFIGGVMSVTFDNTQLSPEQLIGHVRRTGSYFTTPGAHGMPPDYSFTHEAGVKLPHLTRYSIDHLVNRAIHIVAFGTGFDCDMITATQNHFSS